jgi:hypothetical protein
VTEVAPTVFHVRVVACPIPTVVGAAVNETICGFTVTITGVLAGFVPAAPVATKV